ncbi:hypothetical protein D3C85_1603510 [compost metagenome]
MHILVAFAHWRTQSISGFELARGSVYSRYVKSRIDTVYILVDIRTVCRSEVLLLIYSENRRIHEASPILHGDIIHVE